MPLFLETPICRDFLHGGVLPLTSWRWYPPVIRVLESVTVFFPTCDLVYFQKKWNADNKINARQHTDIFQNNT